MKPAVDFNLLVGSYEEAIAFYCTKLKLFNVTADTGPGQIQRFVYLQFHDERFAFGIYLTLASTRQELALVGKQAGERVLLALPVQKFEHLVRELADSDVRFDGEVVYLPYGKQAICFDCFGNRLSLVESFVSDW